MASILGDGSELIAGMTGMGKSMLIAYKLIQSLYKGVPSCYIDPKGETFDAILMLLCSTKEGKELWEKLKHRILILDLTHPSDYLLSFNAIEMMSSFAHAKPDLVALTANNLVEHVRKLSGLQVGEAMRMQNIFLPAVGLLAVGGLTLAELPLLFLDTYGSDKKIEKLNPLVRNLLKKTEHYGTHMFWEQEWANWDVRKRQDWVVSTQDRVFQYLFDQRFLYTVCTTKGTLDFGKVVNEGYWLLVKLPYPTLQSNVTTILGNLIITKLFYACMQRGYGGNPYRLIIDEARFFNTGPLDMILDTAHNLGLDMTLIVQYLDQLSRTNDGRTDPRLLDSALTNCRYITAFKCPRQEDRQILAERMFPLTGQVISGIRTSGDYDYEQPTVEKNTNERRFLELKKREIYLYDSMEGTKLRSTPDVPMIKPDWSKLDYFVGEHLRNTGRPAAEIHREIVERQEGILADFPEEIRREVKERIPKITPPLWEH